MDKNQILNEVREAASANLISKNELLDAFSGGKGMAETEGRHLNLATVMYYIGGTIVFLGISVLISQNWDYFNTPTKILTTLGSGIAAYIVGALLSRYQEYKGLGLAFFLISALVNPIGLFVLADKIGLDTNQTSVALLIFVILLAVYLATFFAFKKIIFNLFSIIFGTIVFFLLVQWLVGNNFTNDDFSKITEYRFLVTGLAYMCLGYYYSSNSQAPLTGTLYGFGSLLFLGAGLALGGWQPNQSAFWELIYPLLVFGTIFLSVYIKSKSFLVFGSLALIGYILKLTAEYFSSGLGWPLALVLAGFLVMGVGYYAVKLNKKYFVRTV